MAWSWKGENESEMDQSIKRRMYPLSATTQRTPLTGSFKKAKSLEGSHISVNVFGRYPPTDEVMFFVKFIDLRIKNFLDRTAEMYKRERVWQ